MYQFNMDPYKFCQVLTCQRTTLSVLEFKYLPFNSIKFLNFLFNVSKISVGNPDKKTRKSLEFCFKKSAGILDRRYDIRH